MDPDEIVDAFRLLGAVYRKAVFELDAAALRTFLLARAEQLIHLPQAQLLEVLAAEVVQQVNESQQLLADLLAVGKGKRARSPRLRLYRSNVAPTPIRVAPPNTAELDS